MKGSRGHIRILSYITQFALNMLVPVFLCSALGFYIDSKLGTGFCFIVLFFVGAAAGARNIYILAKREYTDDEDGNQGEN